MNTNKFTALLKQKRTTLNYSQTKVAELCFLSKSSINHFEQGKRFPSLDILIRLSDVLKTDPLEFLIAALSKEEEKDCFESANLIQEDPPEESQYVNLFISSFYLLNKEEKKVIIDIIDSILRTHKSKY